MRLWTSSDLFNMPNIVLNRFIIFNSSVGQDEGHERDKLLYHWTKDATNNRADLKKQIDDVCLCDASVNASIRLNMNSSESVQTDSSPVEDCDAGGSRFVSSTGSEASREQGESERSLVLTFDSTMIVIVEVEPELSIWIAVHIRFANSVSELNSSQQTNPSFQANSHNHVSSASIKRIIKNVYARFCLLNGTFQMISHAIQSGSPSCLAGHQYREITREKTRQICEDYFDYVLSEVHLNSIITSIPSLYNFIAYLDLNPITLMKVNSFINHLVCVDARRIRHTVAIFNDQLLWSSMNMHDTRLIYNYLVSVLIRDALQEELSKEMDKVRRIREDMTIYLTDVSDEINNLEDSVSALTISVARNNSKRFSKFYLTVFRSSNNMTLGVIMKDPNQSELIKKCEHILTSDSRLGVIPLASLAQSVGQNFLKTSSMGGAVSSFSGKKKQSSSSYGRDQIPFDQKYLCFDRLSVSAMWSPDMESNVQVEEQLKLVASSDSSIGTDLNKNRKLKLTKYLLELEPELYDLKQHPRCSGGDVKEFLAKTTSDTWLTVINSKFTSIYSIHKMRNVGLSAAQQYARSLEISMNSSRPKF